MKVIKNNSTQIEVAQKEIVASGIVLQGYCNSTLQQPDIDLSSVSDLENLQNGINAGLATAKQNANTYLNAINPRVISSLSDLKSYFTIYSSVPVTLPEGASVEEWVAILAVLKNVSEANLRNSTSIVEALKNLREALKADAKTFSNLAEDANDALAGEEGALQSISDDLKAVDRAIRVQIAATVAEGLTIAGGVFVIGIGATGFLLTGGASTELVIGGVVATAVGTATLAASSLEISKLNQEKRDLLQKESTIHAEINLLTGIDSALENLSDQAETAAVATESMVVVWQDLLEEIERLISDLNGGIITTDEARTFFLNSANNEIVALQQTIRILTEQLAGVVTITIPEGESLEAYMEKVV